MSHFVLYYLDANTSIDWEDDGVIGLHAKFIPDTVKSFGKYTCNDIFVEMAQKLLKRKGINRIVIEELKKWEKQPEEYARLAELFSQVDSEHYYIWYLKILHADNSHNCAHLQEFYEKLFSCVIDILNFDNQLWDIAKRNNINLDQAIKKIPFDHWKKGVDALCENNTREVLLEKYNLIHEIQNVPNIRYEYFDMKVSEVIVIYDANNSDKTKIANLNADMEEVNVTEEENYDTYRAKLCDFIEKTLLFYQKYFTESAFTGEMELLPASCRVAVRLYDVLAEEINNDYKKILVDLKTVIGVYPPFDPVIQKYSKLYGNNVVERESEDKVAKAMRLLVEQLKQKAQELLNEGDVENAEIILRQISTYFSV